MTYSPLPVLDYNTLIGIHIDSVSEILKLYSIAFRVTKRADKWSIGTRDYRPDRVNLRLDSNSIVYYLDFG